MSGRLTILPKKTYCPWKPENVERVLRDERLERERIEKEKDNTRRGASTVQNAHATDNGHINLFPEAKEAELRLANGGGATKNEIAPHRNANDTLSGVLPIPLGGDESTNRKLGNVPFYMNTTTDKEEAGEKYNNTNGSFRLGNNRIQNSVGSATTAASDEITNKIMKD